MASAISALTGSSDSSASTTATSASQEKDMFLQLLVSQIKNQDPLNPTDSTQFVSQLAQFSELEQVIAIRGDLDTQAAATSATLPASGVSTSNDSSN